MAEQAHRTRRGFFALILLLLFFLTSFCFQAVLPAGVPVVHVVRHPAMILRSAVQLGWYIDPVIRYTVTEPLSSPVAPFHSPVETYLERICRSMLDNHNIIAQHPNTPAITVRLEDIVNNFRPTMAEVLAHLNIPLSDAVSALCLSRDSFLLPSSSVQRFLILSSPHQNTRLPDLFLTPSCFRF
eukprot:m.249856 g.249856  ORF g.249856 m.249856 type:complete len:184 (+) comp54502_c1_seq12:486-1037(+)